MSWQFINGRPIMGNRGGSSGPNGAPSNLVLTVVDANTIQSDWLRGSANEDSFSLERSTDGTTFAEIATTTAGIVTKQDTTVVANTLYYYRVRALKGSQYSAYSNIAYVTTIFNSALVAGWKFDDNKPDYFSNTMADWAFLDFINLHSAIYYNGKTYISYAGNETDAYIVSYTHATSTWSAPVKVGTNNLPNNDGHGSPCIFIDATGYIHCIWGAHGNVAGAGPFYSKSHASENIATWDVMTPPAGEAENFTYPQMMQMSDGTLYLFSRQQDDFNTDINWGYRTSANGGTTWSARTVVIDNGVAYGYFEKGEGDIIHCAFNRGNVTADRQDIYYMYFDLTNWKNKVGSNQTIPITFPATTTKIYDSGAEWIPNIYYKVDASNNVYFLFTEGHTADASLGGPGSFPYKFMKYDGGWNVYNVGAQGDNWRDFATALDIKNATDFDIFSIGQGVADAIGGRIEKWSSTDAGETWSFGGVFKEGNYIDPTLIRNGHANARLLFAEHNGTSTVWAGKCYLWGDSGYVKNSLLLITPEIKGVCEGKIIVAPTLVAGQYGNCFSFAAASKQWIKVEDNAVLSFVGGSPDKPFSITAWIKTVSNTATQGIISKRRKIGGVTINYEWAFFVSASKLFLQCYGLDGTTAITITAPFTTTGTFVFITATYTGSGVNTGLEIYANAISIGDTRSNTGSYTGMTDGASSVNIAAIIADSDDPAQVLYPFDGLIDEVKVWNKVLSVPEMTLVMNNNANW